MSDGSRFVRPSLEQIPPGDPIPGLEPGVASLGLNEGLSGPFPSALAAIAAATATLNRYPERGSATLVAALAARHGVPETQVAVAAGADALIGYVCQAALDPGRCGKGNFELDGHKKLRWMQETVGRDHRRFRPERKRWFMPHVARVNIT